MIEPHVKELIDFITGDLLARTEEDAIKELNQEWRDESQWSGWRAHVPDAIWERWASLSLEGKVIAAIGAVNEYSRMDSWGD